MGIESPNIWLIDDTHMEFHEHLKRLREDKGLTQAQVAESIEIAKNTYIGYEKGTREPRLSELKKMADLFHVEIGELCLEAQRAGLSGWLKMTLKRADGLKAKQKAALLEVVHGYIANCEIARISGEGEWVQRMEDEEIEKMVTEEAKIELILEEQEDFERFHSGRKS